MVETCTVTLIGRGTFCPYVLYFINPNLSDKVLYYQAISTTSGLFDDCIRTGCEDATNYPELEEIDHQTIRFPVMKNSIIYTWNIYSAAVDDYDSNDAELIYHDCASGTWGQDYGATIFVIKNDTTITISAD